MPDNHNVVLPMFSALGQRPEKRYRTVVCDPPWDYKGANIGNFSSKGAAGHYDTMTIEELCGLPVGAWMLDDSTLYLWVPNSFIEQGYRIVRAWGFKPRTLLTWVKGRIETGRLVHHIGLGFMFRNSTEQVIVAIRGRPQTLNHDVPTAFVAPRGEHGEKPAAFYDLVEHVSSSPYLDVFARKQRFGWDTFGDEAYNFGTLDPPEAFMGLPTL